MKYIRQLMIAVLIIMYTAGCGPKKPILEMKEEKTSWEKNALDAEAEIIISEKEGNFCIIKPEEWSSVIIPEKYLIRPIAYTGTTYRVERRDDEYWIKETERYEVGVYDFHTLKLIKILDMKKIMEPYMEEWKIWTTGCGAGEYNGKYYITSNVEKKQTDEEIIAEKEEEYRKLWIDIENEKAFWNDKKNEQDIDEDDNIWMLVGTTILDANGYEDTRVRNHGVLKDTSCIVTPTNQLPEKNEKLYTLFPELKNISREEGMYAHIYLHPQTDNMEAISLILNDGDRLDFDALEPDDDGYYGYYTDNNGERHNITKEEYKQFQRDYEEYFRKEE